MMHFIGPLADTSAQFFGILKLTTRGLIKALIYYDRCCRNLAKDTQQLLEGHIEQNLYKKNIRKA
jgi:hypothetical protein